MSGPFEPLTARAFLVQEAVARLPGIPRGAALLYGRMARFRAAGGHCFASVEYLARDLAAGERTVGRWMAALVKAKLVRRVYHPARRTKVTQFLAHSCFDGLPAPGPDEPGQLGLEFTACDNPVENSGKTCERRVENVRSDLPEVAGPSIEVSGESETDSSSALPPGGDDRTLEAEPKAPRSEICQNPGHAASAVETPAPGWMVGYPPNVGAPERAQTRDPEFQEGIEQLLELKRIDRTGRVKAFPIEKKGLGTV